jgi:hypothetical protein
MIDGPVTTSAILFTLLNQVKFKWGRNPTQVNYYYAANTKVPVVPAPIDLSLADTCHLPVVTHVNIICEPILIKLVAALAGV